MQLGIAYLGLAMVTFLSSAYLLVLPENQSLFVTVGHGLLLPMFGFLYLASRSTMNSHHLGIGYLTFAGLFILVGFFLSTSTPILWLDGYVVGDLLMLVSIGLIYLGSTSLDDPEAAVDPADE